MNRARQAVDTSPGPGVCADVRSDTVRGVTTLEIIGMFVVLPAAIIGVLTVLTVGLGRRHQKIRYQPGQPWEYPNQLWAGEVPVLSVPSQNRVGTELGGAHASW